MKSVFPENIRVCLIMILIALIVQFILSGIYHLLGLPLHFPGIIASLLAIFLILFVLYRNKFQFQGFYNGRKREKLPPKWTRALSIFAGILLIFAPFI